MKKSLRILALLLALLLLCGCQDPAASAPATTKAPTGPADYTVKIVDPLGNGVENVGVKFLQGGEQMGMAITGADGLATKNLERGDYTLQLTFLDVEHSYYYSTENVKLSATQLQAEIVVAYEMSAEPSRLSVSGNSKAVYTLQFADSSVTVTGVKDSSLDGTYAFTTDENGLKLEGTEVQILMNLLNTFTFQAPGMNAPQSIVDAEGNALNAEKDESGIVIAPEGSYTVMSNEHEAYAVEAGCTYVKLNEEGKNYFIFTPVLAGIYEFSVVGEGTIGSYGTPNFAYDTSDTEVVENVFRKTITQDMIGTNGTGTTQLVIGIETKTAGINTYLCINRVADAPMPVEWDVYQATYTPGKYTLPAGSALMEFDLSKSYTLVYNETDQYYHLNSADGPVVLVRLLSANEYTGFAFGNTLLGSNIGAYYYDENDTLVKKVLYNDCVQAYLGTISGEGENKKFTGGMCDDKEGVYPLTKDLETVLKAYGEYMGYWDSTNLNYLFADVSNLNVESAWLFACCYLQ